ncbi:hypothetical protein [uncultured Deinococcus sp.]|uniref:hypothetical protein n=1 Tax=uncultured Deinococcus sp. TaxID=158789 RepID=UPI0025FF5937|nr:hypothetical protein [uncultured Deinococcus sp.]
MKWAEAQEEVVRRMAEQPRGYQARIAKTLGTTPGFINQIVTRRRQVPLEHLDVILESLSLDYDVILRETKS